MPDVRGRIDHMFFDAPDGRLFVAALGNNTVEIIDVKQGTRVRTISGLHEPQGILYFSGPNRIYVANGDDGRLRMFDGTSYQPVGITKLGDDADNIRWDEEEHRVYVGYGSGALPPISETRLPFGGSIVIKWGLRFSPLFVADSGAPYDVTVGQDLYGIPFSIAGQESRRIRIDRDLWQVVTDCWIPIRFRARRFCRETMDEVQRFLC